MNMSLIAKQLLIAWRRCFDNMLSKQLQDFIKESALFRVTQKEEQKRLFLRRFQMKKVLITGITGQDGSYLFS